MSSVNGELFATMLRQSQYWLLVFAFSCCCPGCSCTREPDITSTTYAITRQTLFSDEPTRLFWLGQERYFGVWSPNSGVQVQELPFGGDTLMDRAPSGQYMAVLGSVGNKRPVGNDLFHRELFLFGLRNQKLLLRCELPPGPPLVTMIDDETVAAPCWQDPDSESQGVELVLGKLGAQLEIVNRFALPEGTRVRDLCATGQGDVILSICDLSADPEANPRCRLILVGRDSWAPRREALGDLGGLRLSRRTLDLSRDGSCFAVHDIDLLELRSASSLRLLRTLHAHGEPIGVVAVSDEGRMVAFGHDRVFVHDVEKNRTRLVGAFAAGGPPERYPPPHTGGPEAARPDYHFIAALRFVSKNQLICLRSDGLIVLWDCDRDQEVWRRHTNFRSSKKTRSLAQDPSLSN